MMKKSLLLAASLVLCSVGFAAPQTFKIDPSHSSVGFAVRHFFSKVPGSFAKFDGTIVYDAENVANSKAEATIQVASVNTNDTKRDAHLQNEDFFVAEKFPTITFKSKSWTKTGADTFDIVGDLTIKDVTQEVTVKAKLLGVGPGMRGATLSGWEGTTTIDRTKFNMGYGLPAVGKEVDVTLNIEAVLQK
jgi:polyisoprenoid-binding protein YceI